MGRYQVEEVQTYLDNCFPLQPNNRKVYVFFSYQLSSLDFSLTVKQGCLSHIVDMFERRHQAPTHIHTQLQKQRTFNCAVITHTMEGKWESGAPTDGRHSSVVWIGPNSLLTASQLPSQVSKAALKHELPDIQLRRMCASKPICLGKSHIFLTPLSHFHSHSHYH